MYYGVFQSTDLRDRRTQIKKFSSLKAALKWKEIDNGLFTHDDPDAARNHHHSFKYIYEYHGRIDKKDKIFQYNGTSTYPCTENDKLATYLYKYGTEIK